MAQATTSAEFATWAKYLPVWEEPIVEGLQGANCSPACKAIATCAALAWQRGESASQWRDNLLEHHHEPGDLLLISTAEECMRKSGLWLWDS